MLAAGVGRRLGPALNREPKVCLRFAGRSLLERHLGILARSGIDALTLVIGYRAEVLETALFGHPSPLPLATLYNPRYRAGSVVSLWAARDALSAGGEVLLMDGDVLYDRRLMARLLAAPAGSAVPIDRRFEEGDEPVKVCLMDERIVDFRKLPSAAYQSCGEWVGFLRLSEAGARAVVAAAGRRVAAGRVMEPYEEALREAMLEAGSDFAPLDITGLPWIEIDFAEDVARAEREILPRLEETAR